MTKIELIKALEIRFAILLFFCVLFAPMVMKLTTKMLKDESAREKKEKLYEGRLYLFGFIPLWKVKYSKNEWIRRAFLMSTKKVNYEVEFLEEIEKKDK